MNKKPTKEQLRVLRILSRSDLDYKLSIQNTPPDMIERWVSQYYQEKPVIDDLNVHGIKINTLEDLMYPEFKEYLNEKTILLLVKWLRKESLPHHVKASIVSVLIQTPISKPYAFDIIIDIYKSTDPNYRDEWGAKTHLPVMLGNALTRWIDDGYSDVVFDLLEKKDFKEDTFLIGSTANFKKAGNVKTAKELLLKRLQEPKLEKGVIMTAIMVLRKLGATEAKRVVETYLNHSDGEVRNEAKKTMAKFNKLQGR